MTAKTTANKVEIPYIIEANDIDEDFYIFSDGIKVRVRDVKFAVNSVNLDLRQTIEESTGKPYEQTIIERRYLEALKVRELEAQKVESEKKIKEQRLARAKRVLQDLAEKKKLFFLDRVSGETSLEIPQDLTDGSWTKLLALYESIPYSNAVDHCTLTTNASSHNESGKTAAYVAVVCK